MQVERAQEMRQKHRELVRHQRETDSKHSEGHRKVRHRRQDQQQSHSQ